MMCTECAMGRAPRPRIAPAEPKIHHVIDHFELARQAGWELGSTEERTDVQPLPSLFLPDKNLGGDYMHVHMWRRRYSVTFLVSSVGQHAGGRADDDEEVEPNLATGSGTGRGGGVATAVVQPEMHEGHASLPGEWNSSETRDCSVVGLAFGGGRCRLEFEERQRARPLVLGCRRARGRCDSYPFDR